jgi:hypothetical protein
LELFVLVDIRKRLISGSVWLTVFAMSWFVGMLANWLRTGCGGWLRVVEYWRVWWLATGC